MEIGKLNNWLQVSANIGIVLGLVLVGVQLRQNSELARIQLLNDESQRVVEFELELVGEHGASVWAKSIEDPENLTLEEVRIMEALLWSFIENLRGTYRLAQLGLLEDSDWRSFVNIYRQGGLQALRDHVRCLQCQDPTLKKYPRFKLHDDIAAVAIKLRHPSFKKISTTESAAESRIS